MQTTDRDIFSELRRASLWIALFAAFFVVMYSSVVLLTYYAYPTFIGYLPDTSKHTLRVIFYPLAAASAWFISGFKKKRFSPDKLAAISEDPSELVRHIIITVVVLISLAEVPLICGFLIFFLGNLYQDFVILAVATLFLIVSGVRSIAPVEAFIRKAANGQDSTEGSD